MTKGARFAGVLALTLWAAPASRAADSLERWLDRTAHIESRNRDSAIGDGGRSRGRYQIQERTWARYSRKPWRTFAHDPRESRRVARLILIDCQRACRKARRPATFENARWFYTHGGF